MEFNSIKTKYNYGDRLLHKYYSPGDGTPKTEILIVEEVSINYGIQYVGDKKPSIYISYTCKNEIPHRGTSHGTSFIFSEDIPGIDKTISKLN